MVTEGDWDAGLYLSVLIWATCGYEYAGFLIGKQIVSIFKLKRCHTAYETK
jgi:hypothetical protein